MQTGSEEGPGIVAGTFSGSRVGRRLGWPGFLAAGVALCLALLLAPPAEASNAAGTASKPQQARKPAKSPASQATRPAKKAPRPARKAPPTAGQRAGLHSADDPLDLKSSVALVIDQETDQVLFSKNPEAVLPIASITKLMTALVVVESSLPLDERLTITQEDVASFKSSSSRLRVGTQLTRGEMLHLALMASENRAAHALGRTFPGGLPAFVEAMNARANLLGMLHTRFVEPTGLSSANQSSATDLALLVRESSQHDLIRELSTTPDASLPVGPRQVQFRNTNGLVRNPGWEIALQKTGYISEAGRCVVMQARLAGRKLIMVLLDSTGRHARIGDAERLRAWLTRHTPNGPAAASGLGPSTS